MLKKDEDFSNLEEREKLTENLQLLLKDRIDSKVEKYVKKY